MCVPARVHTQVEVGGGLEEKADFDLKLKTLTFDPVASIRDRVVGNLLSSWTRRVVTSHRDAAGESFRLSLSLSRCVRSVYVVKACCAAD